MQNILAAWLGEEDLKAMESGEWPGPLAQSLRERSFSKVLVLSDISERRSNRYVDWLKTRTDAEVDLRIFVDTERANLSQLLQLTLDTINGEIQNHDEPPNFTFNISSGNRLEGAVWAIIAKWHLDAELIRASLELGVETVDSPDPLDGSTLAQRVYERDEKVSQIVGQSKDKEVTLDDYTSEDSAFLTALDIAKRAALHDIGVFILGEYGTGRTELARAIHFSSHRRKNKCVVVDSRGKTVEELRVELFGCADKKHSKVGALQHAEKGTLIIEQIEEMPMPVQVDLLHVVRRKAARQVGSEEDYSVDVRFMATSRGPLAHLLRENKLQDHLYLLLSVALIRIPPVRKRNQDFDQIISTLWGEAREAFGNPNKILSLEAIDTLRRYLWPGNIRELRAVLTRSILWSDHPRVSVKDVENALSMTGCDIKALQTSASLEGSLVPCQDPSNIVIPEEFSLKEHLDEISRCYLKAALMQAAENKSKVASLLGLGSYQSVRYWMQRLDVK